MKQTIELQGNRKATIEIPYNKLTAQSTQYKQNNQSSECCESKIILLGCGQGKSKQSNISMAALAQLQEAYDRDVNDLNAKIRKLELQRDEAKALSTSSIQKIKKEFGNKLEESKETVELLRAQCRKKDRQIADLLNQKEIIVRNKISEFRQNQYVQKIREMQSIIKLRDTEIQQYLSKVELLQIQKIKSQQQRVEEQIKWERQLNTLRSQLHSLQSEYSKEKMTNSYALKTRDQDNTRAFNELRALLQSSNVRNKDLNVEFQKLRTQNVKTGYQKQQLMQKVLKLQHQVTDLTEKNKNLRLQSEIFTEKLTKSDQALYYIDSQKGQLLLQIESKYAQIQKLKNQLNTREKVYQVKIQRVIDGQAQIQQMRTVVFQLQQQLKLLQNDKAILAEEIKRKEILIREHQQTVTKYAEEIASLKSYIQKREGSFKWVVERQIEKDIVVAQNKPQIYKVSQINEFTREINNEQRSTFQKVSNTIQYNNVAEQIILGGFIPKK